MHTPAVSYYIQSTLQTGLQDCKTSALMSLAMLARTLRILPTKRPSVLLYRSHTACTQLLLYSLVLAAGANGSCTRLRFQINLYASCVLCIGQAFRYSPENAFYIFNQQIYFII